MAENSIIPLRLKNGGDDTNLCSLNSIIQLLHSIPGFLTQLHEVQAASPLLNELWSILTKTGSQVATSALELRRLLALETNLPLNTGGQHDTIELFNYLLDYIPSSLFKFEVEYQYRFKIQGQASGCPTCGRFPSPVRSPQKFLKLALPPTSARRTFNFDNLLKKHFSIQDQLEGRRCTHCDTNNSTGPNIPYMEKCKIVKFPQYFLVQLLRMTPVDGRTIKNLIPIDVVKAGNIHIDGLTAY